MTSPTCPRCGYDQTGAMALWAESCPLTGTCPECGLEFSWFDVLHPEHRLPSWSFEHRSTLWRLLRTSLMSLNPWRLWRLLRMEHPIRPLRLVAVAVFGLLVTQALAGLAHWGLMWMWDFLLSQGYAWPRWRPPFGTIAMRFDAVATAFFPYFDWQDRRFYSTPGLGSLANNLNYLLRSFEPWLFISLAWWCLMPITFLLLPQTLRRARVRKAHVWRVFAYSLVAAPAMMAVYQLPDFATSVSSLLSMHISSALALNIGAATWMLAQLATFALALTTFWALACSRYLKLPRPWLIAAVMTTLSMLLALLIALILPWHPAEWLGPLG